jgi:hypothetical protein
MPQDKSYQKVKTSANRAGCQETFPVKIEWLDENIHKLILPSAWFLESAVVEIIPTPR